MMERMRLLVLASGSKGNAAVVEGSEGALLIDCGLAFKTLRARCDAVGFSLERVRAVLVTHEHSDHGKGLRVCLRGLRKLGVEPAVYVTAATRGHCAAVREIDGEFALSELEVGESLRVASMLVSTFATSHDAVDSLGLCVEEGGRRIGFCTDTGFLTQGAAAGLAGCDVLALETNHDERMLREGPYAAVLKQRVAGDGGHLSNVQAAAALEQLLCDQLACVVGMHISQQNNEPALAHDALQAVLDAHRHPAQVLIARQDEALMVEC
jgi:phosphoribosyl 1,2-cyclic phosphodiesterase